MRVVAILALLIWFTGANNPPAPYQCPTPEDRAVAYYTGQACVGSYSCCYTELVYNKTSRCCYAYGTDAPVKCCGLASSLSIIIILSVTFGIMFIFCIVCVALLANGICEGKSSPQPNTATTPEKPVEMADDTDISLDTEQ